MANNNINSTHFAQDTNMWNSEEEFDGVEARLAESNANTQAVMDANKAVTEANTEANTQKNVENAQTAQDVGTGLQTAGTICTALSAIPGAGAVFGIAGAALSIAGAATSQGGSIAESSATNDPTKAIASSENLANTTSKGVEDIKEHSKMGETTLEEGAEVVV